MHKGWLLSVAACGLLVSPAQARIVHLRGDSADAFIAKHFPNADIPGPASGSFTYVEQHHQRRGHAECFVPAMGGRSEGAVSTCTVRY